MAVSFMDKQGEAERGLEIERASSRGWSGQAWPSRNEDAEIRGEARG